ncbi:MAG: beta-1,6-N-acetylglucosaminyltransferase [Candidatus Nanopelagicales bacterium]
MTDQTGRRRQAILVVTHGSQAVLAQLMAILDDPEIDFFVHVDARTPGTAADALSAAVTRSGISFQAPRLAVNWGSARMLDVTMALLSRALPGCYDRYHLISGQDLPLCTAPEFKEFFGARPTYEYVGFIDDDFSDRVRYFYALQSVMARGTLLGRGLDRMQAVGVRGQQMLGVDRVKNAGMRPKFGPNWFSITHGLASHVVSRSDWITGTFARTQCADEVFLQTVLGESPFAGNRDPDRVHRDGSAQALRLIDWTRGSPHTWIGADLDTVLASDCVFARKFAPGDTETIRTVAEMVRTRPWPGLRPPEADENRA